MEHFTFTYWFEDADGSVPTTCTKTFSAEAPTHGEVAERFTDFLRGCGYIFDCLSTYELSDGQ